MITLIMYILPQQLHISLLM